ncbi:MAG: class I SAM-dependent methyltransferase [bacterium]
MQSAQRELFNRYRALGVGVKLYVQIRYLSGHYALIEKYIPAEGNILDFGCGIGQLSVFLKLRSARRTIYGYDFSTERIKAAQKASEKLTDIYFYDDRKKLPDIKWNAAIFFDTLHYMLPPEQDNLLNEYAEKVAPEGLILIRDVNKNYSARYFFTYVHELIMVSSGLTPSQHRSLYFRNMKETAEFLRSLGFQTKLIPPPRFHPYADFLLVAKKTDNF